MSNLSEVGLENALSRFSRRTTIGDWIVASGSTDTVINVTKSDGTAVSLSTNVINDLTNSMISFESPGVNEGEYRHIASITDTGTITLDQALSNTPATGNPFTILTLMSVDVTASENISQWAGTGLSAPVGDNADGVADVTTGLPRFVSRLTGWTGTAWSRLKLATTGSLQTRDDATGTTGSAAGTTAALIGGSDGTDLRALSTDATGAVKLAAGTNTLGGVTEASLDDASATPGSAIPAKALQVSGSDGTDARVLKTDIDGTANTDLTKVGGTAQTAADWTPLLQGAAVKQSTLTDGSGTITTGGTAQTVFAANATRRYLYIQNNSTAALWINFTTTATASQPSIELAAGASFTMASGFVSTELVSIIGATTGQTFTAKQG